MGAARGRDIPDDLHDNIERNVWIRTEVDGNVTVGLMAYACSLAGGIGEMGRTSKGSGRRRDRRG